MTASTLASQVSPSRPVSLYVVDERGQRIDEALDVCFVLDLKEECRRLEPGSDAAVPTAFHRVRAEGADHALLSTEAKALSRDAKGSLRLEVPRKATVRVDAAPERQDLVLSLYELNDPNFRRPLLRVPLLSGRVRIPAGKFVASLSTKGFAPDLQRLSASPASIVRMRFHPRPGWSLVARLARSADGRPVSGAHVTIAETPGYGKPPRPKGSAVTEADGLALFSGLDGALAALATAHPDFVPSEVPGVTATPGSFAFRDVALSTGGRVRAMVSVHGRGLRGARCEVLTYDLSRASSAIAKPLWQGRTSAEGVCRTDRLVPGLHKLRIFPGEGEAQVNRWVAVRDGQETVEDVALAPSRILGEVRKAGKPVQDARIAAWGIDADLPAGAAIDDAAIAKSDDSGHYELSLWQPGRYALHLRSPSGATAPGHKELTVDEDDQQTVDFDLKISGFHGVVVDEKGSPVEGARVWARLAGLYPITSEADGTFEFAALEEGRVTLTAFKAGFRQPEPVESVVTEGVETPPVTLTLKRTSTRKGQVTSAAGSPVAGAWIGSTETLGLDGPRLYRSTEADATGAFEVEVPAGVTRLFATGPGCPLSSLDLGPEADESGDAKLRCTDRGAALELTLQDAKGQPVPHAGLILRGGGGLVPQSVLRAHLALLGLPAETDGAGHLVVAGIAPGRYDLFLTTMASEETINAGWKQGFLLSVDLAPLSTTEVQGTVGDPAEPGVAESVKPR